MVGIPQSSADSCTQGRSSGLGWAGGGGLPTQAPGCPLRPGLFFASFLSSPQTAGMDELLPGPNAEQAACLTMSE